MGDSNNNISSNPSKYSDKPTRRRSSSKVQPEELTSQNINFSTDSYNYADNNTPYNQNINFSTDNYYQTNNNSTNSNNNQNNSIKAKNSKSTKKSNIIYIILICFFGLVATVSIFFIGKAVFYGLQSTQTSNQITSAYQAFSSDAFPKTTEIPLQTIVNTPIPQETASQDFYVPTMEPVVNFTPIPTSDEALAPIIQPSPQPLNKQVYNDRITHLQKEFHPHIMGYISINDILEEPIMQSDNSYYLTHDSLGNENPTGALFFDESCDLRNTPDNLVVHGHNMKNGLMFGALKRYKVKDSEFYHTHPFISLDTLYEKETYVIFAVSVIDIRHNNANFVHFMQFNFSDSNNKLEYINNILSKSLLISKVDVTPEDKLLTLATCSSDIHNERLLVVARKLRPEEDQLNLSLNIFSSTYK